MKKLIVLLFTMHLSLFSASAQGIPFIRIFTAAEYKANNMNFDVVTDEFGNVFVANFEGLMYYDYANWRMLHTPGITRVTACVKTEDNTIWVGGYNYFGKVSRKSNGEVYLERIGSADNFVGEVLEIFEKDGEVLFAVDNGNVYYVKDGKIGVKKTIDKENVRVGVTDVVDVEAIMNNEKDVVLTDVIKELSIGNGLKALAKNSDGIVIADENGQTLYTITEENGLCSNNMSYIAYNEKGLLWGATDKGVFAIQVPSVFSRFTQKEGLVGEVNVIGKFANKIYVGTDEGLFRLEGKRFVKTPGIRHACWDFKTTSRGLYAATSDGIFLLTQDGGVKQLTSSNTLALLIDGEQLYCCEVNGISVYNTSGQNKQNVCNLQKTKKILRDKEGTIWLQSIYGQVWYKKAASRDFVQYKPSDNTISTIVEIDGTVHVVSSESEKPFPYPLFSCADDAGVTWLTNNEGKGLYRWKDGKRLADMNLLLAPIQNIAIRAVFHQGDEIWLGNDDGVIIINSKVHDATIEKNPQLFIRSVTLGNDSVLWGGIGEMPAQLPELGSGNNDLHFTYSIDNNTLVGAPLYRYRLNDEKWSAWTTTQHADFSNLPDGDYTFSVEAKDAMNRTTDVTSISFYIAPPFYKRWYMFVLYFLIGAALVYLLFRLRLRRLEKDKLRLEKVIKERTAEVVKQKDEIEEKSERLESALNELGKAQNELIRQEKMATVGKLTQGLIDRILNPLNYINNFSKLSEGLIKDVKANIEDEKEHMDEENYEDTLDVLDMLTGNLQKVGEHGQNTTRTLKAMEEMLKDRSGGIVSMDLTTVLCQDEKMLQEYFKKEIAAHHIKTVFNVPEEHLYINGNPEQLSKTIMCLLGNAVYAVVKKAQNTSYEPEIAMNAEIADDAVKITIRDNGIGIEGTIINKIFDPFFTTKTTGEAAGVGLYLSREIVQNHGGDISVKSVKDEFSEFTIILPQNK